jgi:hypothetical protein
MKIRLVCHDCTFPKDGGPVDMRLYDMPVRDDGVYHLTCKRGHTTATITQGEKFDVLIDIAINAIIDGYFREAVASATSSLERFYEYFVRVVCADSDIPLPELERAWKHVRNASERQLGMFVACHILHTQQSPELLSAEKVAFRNDIVHKGRIPTKKEAVAYIDAVFLVVLPILANLRRSSRKTIDKLEMARIKGAVVQPGIARGTMCTLSAFDVFTAAPSQTVARRIKEIAASPYLRNRRTIDSEC